MTAEEPLCEICGLSLAEHILTPDGNQAWREGHWFQRRGGRESGDMGQQTPVRSTGSPGRFDTEAKAGTPVAAAHPAAHRVVCIGHLCSEWHDVDPDAKVRELEAELAKERTLRYAYAERIDGWVQQVAKEQARAEKAGKTSAEWQVVAEQRTEAWQKAEAVSRPEECPWRETDLGCPCEVPGLDNDGVRDKALLDASEVLKKAEARVVELRNLVEKDATKTQLLRFLEAREREPEP